MAEGDITTDDEVWFENFQQQYLPAEGERIGPGEAPRPNALVHISIGTDENFEKMVDFYMKFFNAHVVNYRDKRDAGGGRAAFLSWDARDHRFAILERKGSKHGEGRAGIAHGAFQYESLADLVKLYRQCKEWGIALDHSINHGQSTSFYYHDPDGNEIETYIDNFDTPEECTHFKHWLQYRPGLDYDMGAGAFDAEKMAALVDEGIDEKILRDREEVIRLKAEGRL
ncbi:MAG: VOC family protein [Alphaproteobacteria bacterium]|nr:VOC family protein [Alphaproteobacteria bacterium]